MMSKQVKEMMKMEGGARFRKLSNCFLEKECPPLSTLLSLLEQASERNDEVGWDWRASADSAIVFWRRIGSAPLSTLLSLLEQASARNDEVGRGWRALANYFLEKQAFAPPFYLTVFARASKREK